MERHQHPIFNQHDERCGVDGGGHRRWLLSGLSTGSHPSVSDQSADLHHRHMTVRRFVSVKLQADINDGASAEAGHTSDLRPHRLDGGSVSLGSKSSPNHGGAIEHPDVLMIDAAPALESGNEPRIDAEQPVDLDPKARFLLNLPHNC